LHVYNHVSRAQPLGVEGVWTPKIWTDHPNFFDEECDYRYVTACSARTWVYKALDPNFENVVSPLARIDMYSKLATYSA